MLGWDICFKVALKRPVRSNWAERLQVVHVGSPLGIQNIKTRMLLQVSRIGMRVGLTLLSVLTSALVFIYVAEANVACVSGCVPDARLSLGFEVLTWPCWILMKPFSCYPLKVCDLDKATTQIRLVWLFV